MPISHEEINFINQCISKKKPGQTFTRTYIFKKAVGRTIEINTQKENGQTEKIRQKMTRKDVLDTLEVMQEWGFVTKQKKDLWKVEDFASKFQERMVNKDA